MLVPGAALAGVSSSGEIALFTNASSPLGATYLDVGGTLARVPLAGGAPKELVEDVIAADWTPDGRGLAVVRFVGGKTRMELPIGKVLYVTPGSIGMMRVSPDGSRIAFFDYPVPGDETGGWISVVDREGHKRQLVRSDASSLAWSPDGGEIWYAGADLRAVSLSGRERLVWALPGEWRIADAARDGRILLSSVHRVRETYGKAPGESGERNLSWLDGSLPSALASNGGNVVINEYAEGGGEEHGVYLRGMDGSTPVHVGQGSAFDLSPDGRWIATMARLGTPDQKVILLPTGTGEPRELPTADLGYETGGFSPDGRLLVFGATSHGGEPRMYVQDLLGGSARPMTREGIAPRGIDGKTQISSDGRVVVRDALFRPLIQQISGGDPRPVPGMRPDEYCSGWTADGREMYVVRPAPLPAQVFLLDPATGKREPWKAIPPPDPVGVSAIDWLSVTPDGAGYVYSFVRRQTDLYVVEGLK